MSKSISPYEASATAAGANRQPPVRLLTSLCTAPEDSNDLPPHEIAMTMTNLRGCICSRPKRTDMPSTAT